jgi:hypothetical protein
MGASAVTVMTETVSRRSLLAVSIVSLASQAIGTAALATTPAVLPPEPWPADRSFRSRRSGASGA